MLPTCTIRFSGARVTQFVLFAVVSSGCSQPPTPVPLRSLENAGNMALVCLQPPGQGGQPGLPLTACRTRSVSETEQTAASTPHLYALVTQPKRGEVALLDLLTETVVDANPARPGFNFLPVGANPVDLAASPGGTVTFVATAEAIRPGLYAIPSTLLRGGEPSLLSWPACALPAAPGPIVFVPKAASENGDGTCASPNYAVDTVRDEGDPQHANGDLTQEQARGAKLYVTIPEQGELLVIDAQKVLDRRPGSFDRCPIERRVRLQADIATPPPPSAPTPTASVCPPLPAVETSMMCPGVTAPKVAYPTTFTPQPSAAALSDGKLYLADRRAPVVHVVDVTDPCTPRQELPLLPTSDDEPLRPVTTSALAVSPLTSDAKRFVYAVDEERGSVMVFDVTAGATQRTPLRRDRPDLLSSSPPDRLALDAPVRALTFVNVDSYNPERARNGVYAGGTRCDPSATASPGTALQTSVDFSTGASPAVLRGTFAALTLTSGRVVIVDVDDLDAPCRRARNGTLPAELTGCDTCTASGDVSQASGEASCRVIARHEVRSNYFVANLIETGPHAPSFQTFPLLAQNGNNLRTDQNADGRNAPKLLGPAPSGGAVTTWPLTRGSGVVLDAEASPTRADRNFVLPDAREPRAHVDQDWTFHYEGTLPGFGSRVARADLENEDSAKRGFFDTGASFCDLGVHDFDAARLEGARVLNLPADASDPAAQSVLTAFAGSHGDVVEITQDLKGRDDAYWSAPAGSCSYLQCVAAFGTINAPNPNRSAFRVRTAYQNHLLVDPITVYDATDPQTDVAQKRTIPVNCCFPTLIPYQVRTSQTWVARGSSSGFVHRVVADSDTGRCHDAGVNPSTGAFCDARFLTRTGRAYEVPAAEQCGDGIDPQTPTCPGRPIADRYTFHNAQFYAVIYAGQTPSRRDMIFSWTMTGGFTGLQVDLGRGSAAVAPQSVVYSNSLQRLLVADGALQGVVAVDVATLKIVRQYLLTGEQPMAPTSKVTPVMRQYHAAKASRPDAILFFRMGDFYEMFYEDARLAARELELTLTSRNKGAVDEIPMAGVPYHAAHNYIARLVARGYQVALCEQMADPAKTRGIVPREVVRVITPALITETDQLDARANHFLAAVEAGENSYGIALFDFSTGELRAAAVTDGPSLLGELARAAPRELLLGDISADLRQALVSVLPHVALRKDASLEDDTAREILSHHLGPTKTDDAIDRLPPLAFLAAARAVRFAAACSPGGSLPISRLDGWNVQATLTLDEAAQRHLELISSADGKAAGSLLQVIDVTCTAPGARLLRRWLLAPLVDVSAIRRRQDAVELFVSHPAVRSELRRTLDGVADVERLAVRCSLREATPKDLGCLRDALARMPDIIAILHRISDPDAFEILGLTTEPFDSLPDLTAHLTAALVDRPPLLVREGGIFRAGFSTELDDIRAVHAGGTTLLAELETTLRTATGMPTLKVKYTRVFGWYLEVTGRYLDRVPVTWRRKQTVAGAERFTSDELDALSDKIMHAEERIRELEASLYRELLAAVEAVASRLHRLAHRLAIWDVVAALADVAHRHDYVRPTVNEGTCIDLVDSRHPVVEQLAAAGQFVPNDVCLDTNNERLWLITGPNMAGKSTLMRQVALTVLLAQMGSYVPARTATVGVVDRILSRVGASDNVARGESTFMVEMRETATILRTATTRSLVILDEIGRGTSTYDGLAIAWSVAEHLHDTVGCRTLFATHYHELTEFVQAAPHAANYSVAARELGDDVVFLHKLTPGAASRSYGIAVAKLAGLPDGVLGRARSILASLEAGGSLPGKITMSNACAPSLASSSEKTVHPAVEMLRDVDPDRLTPFDALQFVAKLKTMV